MSKVPKRDRWAGGERAEPSLQITAIFTVKKPGAMSEKERQEIVAWLRKQATNLSRKGTQYNDAGNFAARYYTLKKRACAERKEAK